MDRIGEPPARGDAFLPRMR